MGPAKLAYDRWATLCALEVLKLIADQVERHGSVDSGDIEAVLFFLREIAHSCLDNAEKRLLLPLLDVEIEMLARHRLGATLENHKRIGELLNELERCHRESRSAEFVTTCHSYTSAFGDLIFEEERFWKTLAPISDHAQIRSILALFGEAEAAISNRIQTQKSALRKLESKYTSPHCI